MLFGFWIKDYKLIENKSGGYYILTNALSLILFVGALYIGSNGSAFVSSYYGPYGVLSVFATFIGGAAGVWIVLSLCMIIEKLPTRQIKKLLSYTGRNVMTVYSWHMAVKFLFDAVYICLIKASDFSMLDELDHAYAVTVHKSQGSEYPMVVMPMCTASQMLHTRNLFYTAVTRAQSMVILVGREDIIKEMVENNRRSMRYTGLCHRLGGE